MSPFPGVAGAGQPLPRDPMVSDLRTRLDSEPPDVDTLILDAARPRGILTSPPGAGLAHGLSPIPPLSAPSSKGSPRRPSTGEPRSRVSSGSASARSAANGRPTQPMLMPSSAPQALSRAAHAAPPFDQPHPHSDGGGPRGVFSQARALDVLDLRDLPQDGGGRPPVHEAFTERQILAAKSIVAASKRRGRNRASRGGSTDGNDSSRRPSPRLHGSPRSSTYATVGPHPHADNWPPPMVKVATPGSTAPSGPWGQVKRPAGPAWSEQLQQELVATAESMRAAQTQLSAERSMRMVALKNEERAQTEARIARLQQRENAKELRDSERKMLISAGGMREQREQLESELQRLSSQQQQLSEELEVQRERAMAAEKDAERAVDESRRALEEREALHQEHVKTVEGMRLDELRKARALEREVEGARAEMEAQVEAERVKRIEHTQAMAIKRIGKRDLAKGWTAWVDLYREHQRTLRALKQAGARMLRPKLVACWTQWRRTCEHERQAKAQMSMEERYQAERQEKHALESQVHALQRELESARKAMEEGRGHEVEAQRQMQMKLDEEKAKRVEHLGQMGMRRILQRDLTRGWVAWTEVHYEAARRANLLKGAGARLTRPKLVACVAHWREDYRAKQAQKATLSVEEKLMARITDLEETLETSQREVELARRAGFQTAVDEEEMQRRLDAEMAAEKEKRIEHTKQMALRRIGKRDLTRGWTAWFELWYEMTRQRNMLKAAGSRLARPKLVAAVNMWRDDWRADSMAKQTMSLTERLAMESIEREKLAAAVAKLTAELTEARQAAREGRGLEAELQRQMDARLEAEKEKRIKHTQAMALKRIGKRDLARGWVGWLEPYLERKRIEQALKSAGARLLKPKLMAGFQNWKAVWADERQNNAMMSVEERLGQQLLMCQRELEEARQQLHERDTAHAQAGAKAEADLAAEKQKRVEATQKSALRRIGKRDLSRGWQCWYDVYIEKTRTRNMLRAAGARLTRPKLAASVTLWRHSWEEAQQALKMLTLEGRMREQIANLTAELAEARKAMMEGRGMEAELERQRELDLEAEKEKRIKHTQAMAIKRIGKRDLSRGWTAWVTPYLESRHRLRMLKQAGARMLRPKLVNAVKKWRDDWEGDVQMKARMGLKEQLHHQTKMTHALEAEVQSLRDELSSAKAAMLEGRGHEHALQQQMEEQMAAEKEKRIEHTKQMALRRIGKRDLTRGWTAWSEGYLERKRNADLLKSAGARLARPKLAACVSHWRDDWRVESAAAQTMSLAQKLEKETKDRADMQSRLNNALRELEEARKAAMEGRGLEAEMQRQMEEQLAAEKQKRVEATQKSALRRIGKRDLSRGWQCWFELYEFKTHERNMLRAAGARLTKPKLAACVSAWRRDYEAAQAALRSASLEERLQQQVVAVTAELQQAKEMLALAKEAGFDAYATQAEMQKQMEEQMAAEKEKRIEHTKQMALRRIGKRDLTRGWTAWFELWYEVQRQKALLRGAGARLTRPKLVASVQHWRRAWEAAQHARASMSMTQRLQAEMDERKSLQVEMAQQMQALREELEEARKAAMEGRGLEAEMERQMEERLAADKQKRIEHAKEMAIRRIGKRDLTRGWMCWHDAYWGKRREQGLLRSAGARLMRPKLSASVSLWRRSWEAEHARSFQKSAMTAEEQLRHQLVEAQRTIADLRKHANRDRDTFSSAEEELQRQMDAKLEAEREKRIEHAKEMAIRRIAKRDLAKGWVGWVESYQEGQRIQRMLASSAAKMRRPRLVAFWREWHDDWQAEMQRTQTRKLGTQLSREVREAQRTKEELAKARNELDELRRAVADGRGEELENQRRLEGQLEAEKEKRVEHVRHLAIRRLANRQLASGWMAWYGAWAEGRRVQQLLKASGARLAKPKLVAMLQHWRRDYEAEQHVAATTSLAAQLKSEKAEKIKLERELQLAKEELASSRQAILEGRGLEDEMRRQSAEQVAAEREKRIEHAKQMAIRRLANRQLAAGWQCWHDEYWARVRQQRLLKHAAQRLFRPKLVHGFGTWRRVVAQKKKSWDSKDQERRFLEMSKEQQALETSLADVQREFNDRRSLDSTALNEERDAMTKLQKELTELRRSVADEQARAILLAAKEEKAEQALKAERERLQHANSVVKNTQQQAKAHLEEQLVKLRSELSGELSSAHKTIADLKKQLATMQAEKIKMINSEGRSPVLDERASPTHDDDAKKKKEKREKTTGVLGAVDFDEDRPLGEQLRESLTRHAVRVLDLFRDWDTNGDGEISRKEFQQAMPKLGYDLPVQAINEVFDAYDLDKSGVIDFKELQKMLKPPPSKTTTKLMKKGADKVKQAARPGSASGGAGFMAVVAEAKAAATK